jgi:hypothetical protein
MYAGHGPEIVWECRCLQAEFQSKAMILTVSLSSLRARNGPFSPSAHSGNLKSTFVAEFIEFSYSVYLRYSVCVSA